MNKANRKRVEAARLSLDDNTIRLNGIDVAIIDQLANLLHLAAHHHLDLDDIIQSSLMHYQAERETA
jgi:hypothetical protein